MVTKRLAKHNALAAFASMEAASAALDSLHETSIPHEHLSLLSKEMKKTPGQETPVESRAEGAGPVTKGTLGGIGGGTVGGGVLGAMFGAGVAAIPGVGLAVGAGALYAAIAGAATGSIAGGLLGAEAGGRKQMMLEQTFHPYIPLVETGHVLVGVHSDDPDEIDKAVMTLEDLSPVRLERLEADETFHPPGDLAAVADRTIPSTNPNSPGGEVGRDRREYPDGKLVGMEERGGGPTSGREDAEAKEKRIPSPGDEDRADG